MEEQLKEEVAYYMKEKGNEWMSLNNPDRYKDAQLKEQAMALVVKGHLEYIFNVWNIINIYKN